MWFLFCFKHKTAYEMRISDWSSDVCSSDLGDHHLPRSAGEGEQIELALLAIDQAGKEKAPRRAGDEDVAIESGGKIIWRKTIQPDHVAGPVIANARSEERRVGKECVSTCRSRWSPYH